jgi:ribonuclease T1
MPHTRDLNFRVYPDSGVYQGHPKKVSFMSPIVTVKFALTSVILAVSLTGVVAARSPVEAKSAAQSSVSLAQLPRQARETYERIREGGPFPYDKDGSVFGNRERLLPLEKRGYWREYTVKTPGSRDRGARRIVCGGPPRTPTACFYTADHYASFRKIVE